MSNLKMQKVFGLTFALVFISIFLVLLIPYTKAEKISVFPNSPADDSWPMFQHDPQHSGYTNSSIPPTSPRQKWNFTTYGKAPIRYPVVTSNGAVFFGSDDGNFYALDESSGSVRWFRSIGTNTASSAVDNSRQAVFVGIGSTLCALDTEDGTTKGTRVTSFNNWPWYSSPVFDSLSGTLFIGDVGSAAYPVARPELLALDENNVSRAFWQAYGTTYNYYPVAFVYCSPAVSEGLVFAASDKGSYGGTNLWASNATNNGQIVWSKQFGAIRSSPAVAFGLVYFGCSDKNFYALNESTGELVWQRATGGNIESSSAIDAANKLVFFGSDDGYLYCKTNKGIDMWAHNFVAPVLSSPIVGDDRVLITVGSKLYALNETTGNEIWSLSFTGTLTSPIVSNGVIFVGSSDGYLYALFPQEKTPTSLVDPSTSTEYNHATYISTLLTDKNGYAIPSASIEFSLYQNNTWSRIGLQSTNSQGNSSISYTPDLPAGLYDLKVSYAGDFSYESASFTGKLTVYKEPTLLTFIISPIEVNYHDTRRISTRLEDGEHNPVANVDIGYQILINSSWQDIGANLTDTQGASNLFYTDPYPPGTYQIRALFENNSYYENCTTQASLIISKEITGLSDPTSMAVYNDAALIQTTLSDDENIPIEGLNVTFYVYYGGSWNLIGSAETNNNGYARINFFVSLEPARYQIKARFEGNDLYQSSEYSGSLTVYSRLIIDNALATKETSDLGDVQSVYFHVSWQYNSSAVNAGTAYINNTQVSINATGWAELLVTSSKAAFQEWSVTSIDCNGATSFTQTCPNPHTTWDTILVVLSTESDRVDVGTEIQIDINATYAFDGQPFGGQVTLNDTILRLTSIGRKCYSIMPVTDLVRGLKTYSANTLTVTWDRVEVTLETDKNRINLGESANIAFAASYAYDREPFIGSIALNDSSVTSLTAMKKSYTTTRVIDRQYNVSTFTSNTVSVTWDKVEVTISTPQPRIDIGRTANLVVTAYYAYDSKSFPGAVTLNDTSLVSDSPKKRTYTTLEIQDPLYGLSYFTSNTASVIWDEVIINLSVDRPRIMTGENANVTITAKYAFDFQPFSGQTILNDTVFEMSIAGMKCFTVTRMLDSNYALSNFSSNIVSVIWDNVRVEYSLENPSLGSAELAIALHSEYDRAPIDNAEVAVGGNIAQNKGDGNYVCKLSNWSPILTANITVESSNYQLANVQMSGLLNQNFAVEVILLPATLLAISGFTTYRRRKKKQAKLSQLQELDPTVVGIAKKYGGILTKTVLAYELKKPLETAENSLERLVSKGEAQKITKAGTEVYDIPSARTYLSKIDNQIITALRDSFRGFPEHELVAVTGLTPDVVEESLSRLEKGDIVAFNSKTKEYSLKGVRSGKTSCQNCGELVDVAEGKCPKCGARV